MPEQKKSEIEKKIARLSADLDAMEGVPGDYSLEHAKSQTRHELWMLSREQVKNNMRGLTWDDAREIAKIFCEEYPSTDVLSLTDAGLLVKMDTAGMLEALPEISESEKKERLPAIKSALSNER